MGLLRWFSRNPSPTTSLGDDRNACGGNMCFFVCMNAYTLMCMCEPLCSCLCVCRLWMDDGIDKWTKPLFVQASLYTHKRALQFSFLTQDVDVHTEQTHTHTHTRFHVSKTRAWLPAPSSLIPFNRTPHTGGFLISLTWSAHAYVCALVQYTIKVWRMRVCESENREYSRSRINRGTEHDSDWIARTGGAFAAHRQWRWRWREFWNSVCVRVQY